MKRHHYFLILLLLLAGPLTTHPLVAADTSVTASAIVEDGDEISDENLLEDDEPILTDAEDDAADDADIDELLSQDPTQATELDAPEDTEPLISTDTDTAPAPNEVMNMDEDEFDDEEQPDITSLAIDANDPLEDDDDDANPEEDPELEALLSEEVEPSVEDMDEDDSELASLLSPTDTAESAEDDDGLSALLADTSSPEDGSSLSDLGLESDSFSHDTDDFDDDLDLSFSDEESGDLGSFDHTSGTEMTIAPLGHLIFAPSEQAVTSGSLTPDGKRRKNDTTRRPLKLSASNRTDGAIISNPKLSVTEKGELSFTGTFKSGGLKGALKLTNISDGELTFSIHMSRDIEIQMTNDRRVSLRDFELVVGNGSVELYSEQKVFDKNAEDPDTRFTFGLGEDKEARATAEELPLPVLIPKAQDNKDMREIILEELVFQIYNPFRGGTLPETYVIECTARLSHIKIWGPAHLTDSSCTITMSRTGMELECDGETPIVFDEDMQLEQPSVEIEFARQQKPEFTISGTMAVNLPVIGQMKIPVSGTKEEDGIELSGAIQKKIGMGPIKIGNPQLVLQTEKEDADDEPDAGGTPSAPTRSTQPARPGAVKKTITIQGDGNFFGMQITPKFVINSPGQGQKKTTSFSADFKMPRMNPFKKIPGLKSIPGLKEFMLSDASLGLDDAKKMFVGGSAKLLGIAGNVFIKPKDALIQVASNETWRVSKSFPFLKGTFLDDLIFNNITFTAAKAENFDKKAGQKLRKGLNVYGQVDTSQGVFSNLRKMTGGALPKTVTASIIINPNPRHCKFIVQLPFDIKLSSKASLHSLAFEVSGEPSVALNLILKFTPTKSDPPLLFVARIEFEVIGMALSGTMEGFWTHPFGISGLQVGDLAVEIKFPYAAPPIPIAFGLAGTVQVGDFLLKVAVKLGADDIILLGEISELPIFFLPAFLEQVGLKLGPITDLLYAIDMQFEDVKFKFAPAGGQIGTLYFDPGISAQGKLRIKIPKIIDTTAEAGFNIDLKSGFKLFAKMPNLEVGPLKITGRGQDRKWDTEDDGPILYMALSLTEQRAFMSTKAECLGNKALVDIDVGLSGLKMLIDMDAYATPLILMGIKRLKLEAETYREGWIVGLRGAGEVGFGDAKLQLLGDMNIGGGAFAAKLDKITLEGIAKGFGIPSEVVPSVGIEDLEFYVRFEPVKTAVEAAVAGVKAATKKPREALSKKIDEMKQDFDELKGLVNEKTVEVNAALIEAGTATNQALHDANQAALQLEAELAQAAIVETQQPGAAPAL